MSGEPLLCVVEIPRGSRNKYEYDAALGAIKLDRFVSASVVYPTEDLPLQLRSEIQHFFHIYKDLDLDRFSEVMGWAEPPFGR